MAKWWRGLRTVVQSSSPLRQQSLYSQQSSLYHTIQAIPREYTGSRVAARDRLQGRIPAVVFSQSLLSKDPSSRSISRKQLLTTERKQIQSILKSVELPFFCSTTFRLQIRAGSGSSVVLDSGTILPVKIHRDEETGKILNLVFVWADDGTELKVDVPVVFKGEEDCPGLKKGGKLNKIRNTLKFLCPAEHIPSKIEVDLSNIDIGERVLMSDVKVHPSLKLLSKNENMPLCKIVATNLDSPELPADSVSLERSGRENKFYCFVKAQESAGAGSAGHPSEITSLDNAAENEPSYEETRKNLEEEDAKDR